MYKQRNLRFDFFNETQAFDKEGNNKISLSDVKAMIDSGKIDEEIAMATAEEKRMPYITVYEPVGGWKSVLMSWDEEMECHTPFQAGWFGYDDIEKAKDDARDWAESEEIDLRV